MKVTPCCSKINLPSTPIVNEVPGLPSLHAPVSSNFNTVNPSYLGTFLLKLHLLYSCQDNAYRSRKHEVTWRNSRDIMARAARLMPDGSQANNVHSSSSATHDASAGPGQNRPYISSSPCRYLKYPLRPFPFPELLNLRRHGRSSGTHRGCSTRRPLPCMCHFWRP
jgi:hypothetical protein